MAQGNSIEYRLKRMRASNPNMATRYEAGEFKSMSAAERAAGQTNRPVLSLFDKAQRAVDKLTAEERALLGVTKKKCNDSKPITNKQCNERTIDADMVLEQMIDALQSLKPRRTIGAIKRDMAAIQGPMVEIINNDLTEQLPEHKVMLESRIAKAEEREAKAKESEERYRLLIQSFQTVITEKEYKLIRGCLHPDRAELPIEELKDKLNKALLSFDKLRATVDKKMPYSALRKQGWGAVSPHHAAVKRKQKAEAEKRKAEREAVAKKEATK